MSKNEIDNNNFEKEKSVEFSEALNEAYHLANSNPQLLEQLIFESESSNHLKHNGYVWGKWLYEQDKMAEIRKIRVNAKDKDIERDFDF